MAYFFEGTHENAGEVTRYRAKILNLNAKTREALLEAARDAVEDAIAHECLDEMMAFTFNQAYCWAEDGKEKYAAFCMHVSKQEGVMILDVVFIPASCWKDALAVAKRVDMTDHEGEVASTWVNPERN